jgi:hypothetical protein
MAENQSSLPQSRQSSPAEFSPASRYAVGRQPCANFTPKDELFPGSGNVHECLAPFGAPIEERCAVTRGGLVSFCTNCNRDHHQDGYENCDGYWSRPLRPIAKPEAKPKVRR